MIISAIIAIGLPLAVFLIWRKKYSLKAIPMCIGIGVFIVFALGLQQIMHFFVLRPNPDGTINLIARDPAIYVLYAILAAGIFEETGRFIAFQIIKKRYEGTGAGLSYGIGHGGIEALLLAGLPMVGLITMSIVVNTGNAALLGFDSTVLAQLNVLVNSESTLFLASGVERIIAVSVHISLSMLVWCAVKVKSKLWLYPAAIVIHAIFNIAPAMYQTGMTTNIWLTEGVIFVMAIPIAVAAGFACRAIEREDPIKSLIERRK